MKMPWRSFILAPDMFIDTAAVAYLMTTGLFAMVTHRFGHSMTPEELNFPNILHILLCLTAFIYGILRIGRYHPAFNSAYARWLMATPWTSKERLPLGSVYLAWQDLVVLAPIFLLDRFHAHFNGIEPLSAFFYGYLAVAAIAIAVTRPNWALPLMIAGFPLAFFLPEDSAWILALMCAIYVPAAYGLRATLRGFPWKIGVPCFQARRCRLAVCQNRPGRKTRSHPSARRLAGIRVDCVVGFLCCIFARSGISESNSM